MLFHLNTFRDPWFFFSFFFFSNILLLQLLFTQSYTSVMSVSFAINQKHSKDLCEWSMASNKMFPFLFFNDFYAINHNGTKMCHGIVHFLDEMLLCGCGFFWVSGVIGPHVNMMDSHRTYLTPSTPVFYLHYSNVIYIFFRLVEHRHTQLCKDCDAPPSNAVEKH